MKTIKRNHIQALLLFFALLMGGAAQGQDTTETPAVQVLTQSKLRPVLCDVYLFGAGSYNSHPNLWTANNGSGGNNVYETFLNAGLEAEVYRTPTLRFGGALGYKYQRYAYDAGLSGSEGVYSHWLTADLNVNYLFMCAGLLSDIYLNSYTKNNDHFSYEGLHGDCFNKASMACYFGFNTRFTRIKAEARIGFYVKPQLNPDKIAHYNLHKSDVRGLYWELKLSYRLFTSGKHYQGDGLFE